MIINFLRIVKWVYIYPYFRNFFKDNKLNKELIKKYQIHNISVSKLKKYKSSDTLFILGAGQSINNLSDDNFLEIKKADSIGINGFANHKFVPTFHSFELENQHNSTSLNMFIDTSNNIINLRKEYKNTAIVFRQNKIINTKLENNIKQIFSFGNSYWNVYDQIPGNSIEEYKKYLKHFKTKGLFENNDFFPNKSSSLSWVISMAYQLKYKKIIFCGVDLIGDHFYNNNSPLDELEFNKQKAKRHLTGNITKQYPVVIQDIIKFWNEYFFSDYKAELYVSSKFSLLSEILPVYKFKKIK